MTARDALWDVAIDQYGYVTAKDATDLGLAAMTIQMLVRRGGLEKVAHGVYRFPELPVTEYDSYMLAVLWTGVPEACLSHETALALYDVCDANPTKVHMTVPRDRRVRRSDGEQYVLHDEDLEPEEIGWLHQIRRRTRRPPSASASATASRPTFCGRPWRTPRAGDSCWLTR